MPDTTTRRGATNRPGRRTTRGRPARGGTGRSARWPRWLLIGLLGVATVLIGAAYFTPLLGVRAVKVTGNTSVDQDEIVRAAAVDRGTPMPRVDTEQVERRVDGVTKVAGARVALRWPDTVRISVTERKPAAYQVRSGGVELVDLAGVRFSRVAEPPAGLPRLRVDKTVEDGVRTAMTTLRALPAGLREQVDEVLVRRPRDVRLRLSEGRMVHWGTVADVERKARVLPLLLSQPGAVYDVTTPDLPTISDRE